MSSYFRITDDGLREFIKSSTKTEQVNTLYEICSLLVNYANLKDLKVMENEDAVITDNALRGATKLQGFLMEDLPRLLLDREMIVPTTKKQIVGSLIKYPTPSSNAIPGFIVKECRKSLGEHLDNRVKYFVMPEMNEIIDNMHNILTDEEKAEEKRITLPRLKHITFLYLR